MRKGLLLASLTLLTLFVVGVLLAQTQIPPAKYQTVNLGLAVSAPSGPARLYERGNESWSFVFWVWEVGQGTDLNGDGDTNDWVLHIDRHRYELSTPQDDITNLGLGNSQPRPFAWDWQYLAFDVEESAQGNTDLNLDGDTGDRVIHLYDTFNGTTTNLALAGRVIGTTDELLVMEVSEAEQGGDANLDGDNLDQVVIVRDLTTGTTTNLRYASEMTVLAKGEGATPRVAFVVPESPQGPFQDLNGDGDTNDKVLHIYDPATGVTNLGLAVADVEPIFDHDQLAFMVSEDAQGSDLDGDGDQVDNVVHVYDAATGTTANLGVESRLETTGWDDYSGSVNVAVSVRETTADLNGDGDLDDWVAHNYQTADGSLANMQTVGRRFLYENNWLAFQADEPGDRELKLWYTTWEDGEPDSLPYAGNPQRFSWNYLTFTVDEQVDGADLNGDGDSLDGNVLFLHDLAGGGSTTNLGYALGGLTPVAMWQWTSGDTPDDVFFTVSEADQGAGDLNGDGDAIDVVLFAYDIQTQITTNLGVACGKLAGPSGGLLYVELIEEAQGSTDLNGDGDTLDFVAHAVRIHRPPAVYYTIPGTNSISRGISPYLQVGETFNRGILFWEDDLFGDALDKSSFTYEIPSGATIGPDLSTSPLQLQREVTWTPTATGNVSLEFRIQDDSGFFTTDSVGHETLIVEPADPPTFDMISSNRTFFDGNAFVQVGQTLDFTVHGEEANTFDVMTIDGTLPTGLNFDSVLPSTVPQGGPTHSAAIFEADGNWTPGAGDVGGAPAEIRFTVSDEGGVEHSTDYLWTVTVEDNHAPEITVLDDGAPVLNSSLLHLQRGSVLTLSVSAQDVNTVDDVELALASGPGSLTNVVETGSTPFGNNAESADFTWTPQSGDPAGTYTVELTCPDPAGLGGDAVFAFGVELEEPAAPVFAVTADSTPVSDGQILMLALGDSVSVAVSASDANADDTVSLSWPFAYGTQSDTSPVLGNPAAMTLDWTPPAGLYALTWTATDGALVETFTLNLAVVPPVVEHDPTIAIEDPPGTPFTDDPAIVPASTLFTVYVVAADEDAGDLVTISIDGTRSAAIGTLGADTDAADESAVRLFSWTPAVADAGNTYDVYFVASDGSRTSEVHLQIQVPEIPHAPVIGLEQPLGTPFTDDPAELLDGVPFQVYVVATDEDAGDTVSVTIDGTRSDPVGSFGADTDPAANGATRLFSWTPGTADAGRSYDVYFVVSDGVDSAEVRLTMHVTASPAPPYYTVTSGGQPVAAGETLTAQPDQEISFTVHVDDPNDETIRLTALNQVGAHDPALPVLGNPVQTTFTWTPTATDAGLQTITYTAESGADSVGFTVKIQVPDAQPTQVALYADPDRTETFAVNGQTREWLTGKQMDIYLEATPGAGWGPITGIAHEANPPIPTGDLFFYANPDSGDPTLGYLAWIPTGDGSHTVTFTATDGTNTSVFTLILVTRTDTDDDGIPDAWELNGYDHPNGQHVDLPDAVVGTKDIYLRIDYMAGYEPDTDAIQGVVEAFARQEIALHVTVGNEVPLQEELGYELPSEDGSAGPYHWGDFQAIKDQWFPEELTPVWHYCLFAHTIGKDDPTGEILDTYYGRSGVARETPVWVGPEEMRTGSDFIVSLGIPQGPQSWTVDGGSTLEQSGTLMHELGHNLDLRHGGFDELNRKPNYLSVMNYNYQLEGLMRSDAASSPRNPDTGEWQPSWTLRIDYSPFAPGEVDDLDEDNLNEPVGLTGSGLDLAKYGTRWWALMEVDGKDEWVPQSTTLATDQTDWNADGSYATNVSTSLNQDFAKQVLKTHDDWSNLFFYNRAIGSVGAGRLPLVTYPPLEVRAEEAAEMRAAPAFTTAYADPSELWPPEGNLVDVRIHVDVSGETVGTPEITGVTCNESMEPGDWERTDDPFVLKLRATRAGSGSGRIYTVWVRVEDEKGSVATAGILVTVPHDQGQHNGNGKSNGNGQGNGNGKSNGNPNGQGGSVNAGSPSSATAPVAGPPGGGETAAGGGSKSAGASGSAPGAAPTGGGTTGGTSGGASGGTGGSGGGGSPPSMGNGPDDSLGPVNDNPGKSKGGTDPEGKKDGLGPKGGLDGKIEKDKDE